MINLYQTLEPLVEILPHKKVAKFVANSMLPQQMIERFESLRTDESIRSICMCNGDGWRYAQDQSLLSYIKNDDRYFYNAITNYENNQVLPNYWELAFPCNYFTRLSTPSTQIPKLKVNASFGYSCLNNRTSVHRIMLGCKLFVRDLLHQVIFTQNTIDWPVGYHEYVIDQLPGIQEYKSILPIKWNHESISSEKFTNDHTIDHAAYHDAYCNIVTETGVEEFYDGGSIPAPIITEKSNKPFLAKQVPLFLASSGHIPFIKSLGFEPMEELMPIGYDQMNLYQKVDAIVDVVGRGKEFIQEFYHTHIREIQHNYDLIMSDRVDKIIINRIKQLITL